MSTRKTIHILGGGPAGLSAAWHLTNQPGWQDLYDVVIYQMGWRLGGKGASGRNADACSRIEEHGIHLFGNMYANTLHMMNATYQEVAWKPGEKITSMETAFLPSNFQMVTDFHDGKWSRFGSGLPHNDEIPWEAGFIATPKDIFEGMVQAMIAIVTDGKNMDAEPHEDLGEATAATLIEKIGGLLDETKPGLFLVERSLRWALNHIRDSHEDEHHDWLVEVVRKINHVLLHWMESALEELAEHSEKFRGIYIQMDLLLACIRGFFEDELLTKGIDSIDGVDYRTWLKANGISDLALNSAAPQAIPNTCMQYPGGDSSVMPEMSAAAYMTFVLRQITAKGQGAYFFAVSTGETVILPLYRALQQRGVEVKFFHKVTALKPPADGNQARVGAIQFQVQAHTPDDKPYVPTYALSTGEEVWPSEPLYKQLVEGDALREGKYDLESWWTAWKGKEKELTLNPDEDIVVVAMPIDCHQYVCDDVAKNSEGWQTMIGQVTATPTQQLQIWLDTDTEELGWDKLEGTNRHLGPTYSNPLSAWGDFSESVQWEQWPDDNMPKSCIYFCGPLQDPQEIPGFDDHNYPERMKERVFSEAAQYLRNIGGLLPNAGRDPENSESLDFGRLVCYDPATAGTGINRLRQQYYRANIDPNERYTLSTPGSLQYRLHAWESGIDNVVLCGDWCYTGFNIGSFEGSVMAGMLAAHAISGTPGPDDILGYHFLHPDAKSAPRKMI